MKIRNGFVSNSSSASYTVEVRDIGEQDFFGRLQAEYSWSALNLQGTQNRIEAMIKECEKHIEECEENERSDKDEDRKGLTTHLLSLHRGRLSQVKNLLEESLALDEDDFAEVAKFILKFRGISYKEDDGDIELEYFTSMHNDYCDSMGELMQEIALFFMFETDYKVKCRVDHDA